LSGGVEKSKFRSKKSIAKKITNRDLPKAPTRYIEKIVKMVSFQEHVKERYDIDILFDIENVDENNVFQLSLKMFMRIYKLNLWLVFLYNTELYYTDETARDLDIVRNLLNKHLLMLIEMFTPC
jgi:hypothetical protein